MRVTILDHSGQPGGGQLGLKRYMEGTSSHSLRAVFVTGGTVATSLANQGLDVRVIDRRNSFKRSDLWTHGRSVLSSILEGRPECVLVNSAAAAKVIAPHLGRIRVPVLYYMRTDLSRESLGRVKQAVLSRLVYSRFDGFVANSTWTHNSRPTLLSEKPIRIAYPISGVTAGPTNAVNPSWPRVPNQLRIVSLSRPEPWKGLVELVQAVELAAPQLRLRGVEPRLDLYGGDVLSDAAYVKKLESLVANASFEAHLRPHVSDVSSVLSSADVLVLSSIKPEPFGQVLVQGLQAGALVIAPDVGGPTDVIHHGLNGLSYTSGSVEAMSTQISDAVESKTRSRELIRHGNDTVRAFSDASTAPSLDKAIRELVRECLTARPGRDRLGRV